MRATYFAVRVPLYLYSKQKDMVTPFSYGRIAEKEYFTGRSNEVHLLTQNFKNIINTVIISPRR